MPKTIQITQAVAEETPAGSMPTIQTAPSAGIAYDEKAILETDVPVGGSSVLPAAPALTEFEAKAVVIRIYSEESGVDVSDNFLVRLRYQDVATLPTASATYDFLPTPDGDGAIQLTIPARVPFGALHTPGDLISVTVTDLDALHADATKATIEAVA